MPFPYSNAEGKKPPAVMTYKKSPFSAPTASDPYSMEYMQKILPVDYIKKLMGEGLFPSAIPPKQVFTEYDPYSLGFSVDLKLAVKGLAGCEGKILSNKRVISPELVHNTKLSKEATAEQVVDRMLHELKDQIMKHIKEGK